MAGRAVAAVDVVGVNLTDVAPGGVAATGVFSSLSPPPQLTRTSAKMERTKVAHITPSLIHHLPGNFS
ncbi:MAG: hypothetical protein EXR59_03825 [Dehalococcoidia bacterium]|nr:hypothetical protein [Dehalococcoidia bacterium]